MLYRQTITQQNTIGNITSIPVVGNLGEESSLTKPERNQMKKLGKAVLGILGGIVSRYLESVEATYPYSETCGHPYIRTRFRGC